MNTKSPSHASTGELKANCRIVGISYKWYDPSTMEAFSSQGDGTLTDFLTSEWPDLPDVANADNYLREAALAHDPPSKAFYDPERDGIRCRSLGVHEHWNNGTEEKYSGNLGKAHGIELFQVS